MWWSRRALALTVMLALTPLAPVVTGCGFQPLHSVKEHDPAGRLALSPPMALEVPSGRVGRALRLRLMERLNLPDPPPVNAWTLELRLHEEQEDLLIQPDAEVTRRNYILLARATLLSPQGGESGESEESGPALTLFSRTSAAYNRVRSEFANIAALRDAERRATVAMADDITLRLSVFFVGSARQAEAGAEAEEGESP